MSPILFFFSVLSCFHLINGFSSRINNGRVVSSNDYKFIVGIQLDSLFAEYYCTGGVIHEKYVLTAAHCFASEKAKNPSGGHSYEYKKFKVSVYSNTDNMRKISKNTVKRIATDVYFTRQFFEKGIDDIAILKLNHKLNGGMMLPQSNNEYYNRLAVIAGYGKDPEGDKINNKFKGSLKTMSVKIVGSKLCENTYSKLGIPVDPEKQLCAQAIESYQKFDEQIRYPLGTCRGDSGAPILYQGNIVIGIVSRGINCDSRIDPELPMRVSNYLDFINTVIHEKSIDPNHITHYSIKNKYF